MPIYEYYCDDCEERVRLFFRSFAEVDTKPVICPQCGESHLARVISKVAIVQTESRGQGSLSSSGSQPAADQSDPKSLARSMREASQGQDFGREFKEVATRLESGEKPASIEKSLRQRSGQDSETH
ncbi:MAG: zinc ribbon domain-containing protein [Anaerolineales bacterium]|nr:zinc ribbon domain-containing protein [Anaerolineales bacterium]